MSAAGRGLTWRARRRGGSRCRHTQAARLLGVSERRVRALVAEGGRLTVASRDGEPLRLTAASVDRELKRREERRTSAGDAPEVRADGGRTADGQAADVRADAAGDLLPVPRAQWDAVLAQLANLHQAGQELAEARERAAKAETEAAFLRERLAELRERAVAPVEAPVEALARRVRERRGWWPW